MPGIKFWDGSMICKVHLLSVHLSICLWTLAKTVAKLPNIIGFWIFKCLWNHLINMFKMGGWVPAGGGELGGGLGLVKIFYGGDLGGKHLSVTKHDQMSLNWPESILYIIRCPVQSSRMSIHFAKSIVICLSFSVVCPWSLTKTAAQW